MFPGCPNEACTPPTRRVDNTFSPLSVNLGNWSHFEREADLFSHPQQWAVCFKDLLVVRIFGINCVTSFAPGDGTNIPTHL